MVKKMLKTRVENISEATQKQKETSVETKHKRAHKRKVEKSKLLEKLIQKKCQFVNLAPEKGASNWLNVLPLTKRGFSLNKSEFRDGLQLKYGNEPRKLAKTCPCGHDSTITHALQSSKGEYTHLRYNEIRNTVEKFMHDVCHDVENESLLQSFQGKISENKSTTKGDKAHLDIKAIGVFRDTVSLVASSMWKILIR